MNTAAPQAPIFIVGPGRSGTTLVRSILSAHPRITIPAETHFLLHAANHGLRLREAPKDFNKFWEYFKKSVQFASLDISEASCLRFLEMRKSYSFKDIFDSILVVCQEKAGKPRVGEKTPDHAAFIGYLLDWYPDARIIFLQRDPRAMTASQLKTPWVKEKLVPRSWRSALVVGSHLEMVAFLARYWSDQYDMFFAPFQKDARVMLLKYEDMIHNPEENLRRICRFIEEDFDEIMISGHKELSGPSDRLDDKHWPEWHQSHFERSRGPVKADSLNKWRAELRPMDLMMIEGRCEAEMRKAGYEFTCSAAARRFGRLLGLALTYLVKVEVKARTFWAPHRRGAYRNFSLASRRRREAPVRSTS
jgi:Sulfotransferase family